jgi:hypothetical protein
MLEVSLDFRATTKYVTPEALFDLSLNGPMLAHDEEAPIPWDADIYVEDGCLHLVGGAGAGGFGKAHVSVPVAQSDYFRVFLEVEEKDLDEVIALLAEQDVRIREIKNT